MDGPRHPRYRDREDSRFYKARGLSPEETWQVLGDELARVLDDAQRAFWQTPLRMDPEHVRLRACTRQHLSAEKVFLTERITTLGPEKVAEVCAALATATSCC